MDLQSSQRKFWYNKYTGEIRWRMPQGVLDLLPRPTCSDCQYYEAVLECQTCQVSEALSVDGDVGGMIGVPWVVGTDRCEEIVYACCMIVTWEAESWEDDAWAAVCRLPDDNLHMRPQLAE
jgi:hypothetical protein